MQQEKKNGKRKTGINRKKRRRKGNRNRHKKGMKARQETKARQGKTGKNRTITPCYTILDVRCSHETLSKNVIVVRFAFVRKGHFRFCRF